MCLILFALAAHPRYRLIIAANRDESYERPAAPAAFWEDYPDIYAGRDAEKGGTWLGVTRTGRVAVITNYRHSPRQAVAARSRGELVSGYLSSNRSALAYAENAARRGNQYNGYSLLAGTGDQLVFQSNRIDGIVALEEGVHGLSNRALNEPWPKVQRGKVALADAIRELGDDPQALIARLLEMLSDRTSAPDEELPDTGVGLQRERELAPIFIAGTHYGTRASTVVLMGHDQSVVFAERSYGPRGAPLNGVMTARFNLDD